MIDEILVHISTAATRQNDDLYLSLAEAYQAFEPHSRLGHEYVQQLRSNDTSMRGAAMNEVSERSDAAGSSIVSTSKESYGSFPSLLSSDGAMNNSRNVDVISGSAPAMNDSIPTSSRLARLDKIHQHWKQHVAPRSSFIGGPTSSGKAPKASTEQADPSFADTTFIEDTQLGAQALQSQLPDEYSLTSEDTSEDEDDSIFVEKPQISSTDARTHIVNEVSGRKLSSSREGSMAAADTVSTRKPESIRLNAVPNTSPPVMHPSVSKQKISGNESDLTKVYDFSRLAIDVYPPPPKISTERPGRLPSQVTKHLAAIKTQNPKRFKFVRKDEKPRADDRGYWCMSTSDWPSKIQHDFWISMSEHISSGRVGWGVTLHREGSSASSLGSVRLYCWGELIEHTWLLLWLSSHGEIAKSGSTWVNADRKLVYEVQ